MISELKDKTILFLGGGRSNIGALLAAKELGLKVYVAGLPGKAQCYELADKVLTANIMDKYAVDKVLENEHIDGALICCSDRAIETVGYLNTKYNLKGISEQAAIKSCNKYMMKQALLDGGVSTAQFVKVSSLEDVKLASSNFSYPLMVKAVDLQSSKGIYICKTQDELFENFTKVLNETHKDYCIIEEFISGVELGAQSFIYNGEVLFVQPHGDIVTSYKNSTIPIGHYTPLLEDDIVVERIKVEAKKAIKAMGMDNCAVNIDFIVRDGIPYVLELTGRVGANCLPEMISKHLGINYYKMIVAMAVGCNPRPFFVPNVTYPITLTRMINSNKSGVIKSLEYNTQCLPYVKFFVEAGDEINAFRNSNDCIGEMLSQGNDLAECENQMNLFLESLKINLL